MKLFIDECLSPTLAKRLCDTGRYDAIHPRDYGRLGDLDHTVLRNCLDEDRTIVTENARDFRQLVGAEPLHPGLLVLPNVGKERSWELLTAALEAIAGRGEPRSVMVNTMVKVTAAGEIAFYDLPTSR